jgi:hypothetical protein
MVKIDAVSSPGSAKPKCQIGQCAASLKVDGAARG